jgi:hypothetical protein
MRKLILFTVLTCCAFAAGCTKDAAVRSFLGDIESVTKEITQKLDAGDIAGAKNVFADKKGGLKEGFDAFKNAREIQFSAETKKELEKSVTENVKALSTSATKAAIGSGDKDKAKEIQNLLKEFVGIFQM